MNPEYALNLFTEGLSTKKQDAIAALLEQVRTERTPGHVALVIISPTAAMGSLVPLLMVETVNQNRDRYPKKKSLQADAAVALVSAMEINSGIRKLGPKEDPELAEKTSVAILAVSALNPAVWEEVNSETVVVLARIFLNADRSVRVISAVLELQAPAQRSTGRATPKVPAKVRRAPRRRLH